MEVLAELLSPEMPGLLPIGGKKALRGMVYPPNGRGIQRLPA